LEPNHSRQGSAPSSALTHGTNIQPDERRAAASSSAASAAFGVGQPSSTLTSLAPQSEGLRSTRSGGSNDGNCFCSRALPLDLAQQEAYVRSV